MYEGINNSENCKQGRDSNVGKDLAYRRWKCDNKKFMLMLCRDQLIVIQLAVMELCILRAWWIPRSEVQFKPGREK